MVRTAARVRLACAFAWLAVFSLPAKDFAADAFDSSAAQRTAAVLRTPAIFRTCPGATNAVSGGLTGAFDFAHSNFLAAVRNNYQLPRLDAATTASAGFGYFVTAFNLKNRDFPVPTDLARRWARGDAGLAARDGMIELLLKTMRHAVRPDELPAGFNPGDTVRLVEVASPGETLTLKDAERRGRLAPLASVITLTGLRELFRQGFPPEEQLTARALAAFLQPNCAPDVQLTQQARDATANGLAAVAFQDAAQPTPSAAAPTTKIVPAQTPRPPVAQPERRRPPEIPDPAPVIRERIAWLAVGLSGISVAALLIFWWQLRRQRAAAAVEPQPRDLAAPQIGLAPHLTQVVKDVLVRELAAQRNEMFESQQAAVMELARLTRRLDELQTPVAGRLRSYETRIRELEVELAARTGENHELLMARIEMLRRQLKVERAGQRLEFN